MFLGFEVLGCRNTGFLWFTYFAILLGGWCFDVLEVWRFSGISGDLVFLCVLTRFAVSGYFWFWMLFWFWVCL